MGGWVGGRVGVWVGAYQGLGLTLLEVCVTRAAPYFMSIARPGLEVHRANKRLQEVRMKESLSRQACSDSKFQGAWFHFINFFCSCLRCCAKTGQPLAVLAAMVICWMVLE